LEARKAHASAVRYDEVEVEAESDIVLERPLKVGGREE
jgi:hypothetical protein